MSDTTKQENPTEENPIEENPAEEKPKKEKRAKKEKKSKKEKAAKMKTCPFCQQEIPKKAKICPHCAGKQKGAPLPLILAAVLLLLIAVCGSIVFFHFPVAPPFDVPIGAKHISDTVLGTGMELSKKEEEAMLPIFEECGFTKIVEVRTLSSDDQFTIYAVHDTETIRYLDGDVEVEVNNKNKSVRTISCGDQDIYVSGYLITPITEFYLSGAERDVYLSVCLDAVKARLDFPETAVFPAKSSWKYTMDGGNVTVTSSVTAKDGSGQEIVRPFRVEFEDGAFASFAFLAAEE